MSSAKRKAASLIAKLRGKSSASRDQLLAELVALGAAAVGPLTRALEDKDYKIRMAAAEALGALGDDEAIGPLILALSDSSKNTQAAAAEALARIGDAAVPALLDALIGADQAAKRVVRFQRCARRADGIDARGRAQPLDGIAPGIVPRRLL